jgi:hypothetical protein
MVKMDVWIYRLSTRTPSPPEVRTMSLKVRLAFVLFALAACVGPARGVSPAGPAPVDENPANTIESLIDQLTEVAEPDFGYSPSVSGTIFLPLDREGQMGAALLGQAPLKRSAAMRELEKRGAAAVPHLIAHLDDKRPTKLQPIVHSGGFGGLWTSSGFDFNANTQKPPTERKAANPDREDATPRHTVTVGDLCYVALGQIVNRNFVAVRYQPTAIIVVASPVRDEVLRAAIKEHWAGLTPEKHKAALVNDFLKPDDPYRRSGAAKRLAYYYTEALEDPTAKFLSRPTYNPSKVESFLRTKLYAAPDAKSRKALFDEFVAANGEASREGIQIYLFGHLSIVESTEEGRLFPPQKEFTHQPRTCLMELFDKPKGVKSTDAPRTPASTSSADLARFIRDALVYDHSPLIDRAVRNLLVTIKDDDGLALSCMERLVGRGFDDEIENYAKGRPGSNELRAMTARAGWTRLHVAVSRGNADDLAELLRRGETPGAAAKDGMTALHLAAAAGDDGLAKLLLDAKAPPDAKNKLDESPALLASRHNHHSTVRLLVERGAVVSDVLIAAAAGDGDRIKKFIAADVGCVKLRTEAGWTALHIASDSGQLRATEALLAGKAPVDEYDGEG